MVNRIDANVCVKSRSNEPSAIIMRCNQVEIWFENNFYIWTKISSKKKRKNQSL